MDFLTYALIIALTLVVSSEPACRKCIEIGEDCEKEVECKRVGTVSPGCAKVQNSGYPVDGGGCAKVQNSGYPVDGGGHKKCNLLPGRVCKSDSDCRSGKCSGESYTTCEGYESGTPVRKILCNKQFSPCSSTSCTYNFCKSGRVHKVDGQCQCT